MNVSPGNNRPSPPMSPIRANNNNNNNNGITRFATLLPEHSDEFLAKVNNFKY